MFKKLIIISTFILLLFGINFFSLKSYYYNKIGERYFTQNDLNTALKYFSLANDDFGKYNQGNIFYENDDFSGAINNYESILNTKKTDLLFNTNHNLGNSYYRIGEKLEGDNKKGFYEKSVNYYSGALNIKEDNETRANLEFVLKKLKEEEKEEDTSDENSGYGSQDNSTGSGSENQSTQNNSSNNKGNNSTTDSKYGDSTENLTLEQIQAISDYKEALKKEQDYNSEGFNKVYEGDGNGDIFDSFFNNSLLNQDEKKDW